MMEWRSSKSPWARLLVVATAAAMGAWLGVSGTACSSANHGGAPGDEYALDGSVGAHDPCDPPSTGCACNDPARVVECGSILQTSGDYTYCSMGHRICGSDLKWGDCIPD